MRKIWKNPVLVVALLLLAASVVSLLGYAAHMPYFRDSELGWIITSLIAGLMTLIFSYIGDYLERKKARSKVR